MASGTVNTLTKKIQNDSISEGIDGTKRPFSHPWFQTAVMFAGELLCLFFFFIQRAFFYCKPPEESADADPPLTTKEKLVFKSLFSYFEVRFFILIIPTFCDILGTSFGGIGLLWISASVWQMMRGTIILFSGFFTRFLLKRKLEAHRWVGMSIVAAGLAVVGLSSYFEETSQKNDIKYLFLGLGFVVLGFESESFN